MRSYCFILLAASLVVFGCNGDSGNASADLGADVSEGDSQSQDTTTDEAAEVFDSGGEVVCDDAGVAISEGLAGATAGDLVVVAPGSYTGSFVVPAGVTVCASTTGEVTLIYDGDGPLLRVETDNGLVTTVSSFTLESAASEGVLTSGQGAAVLDNLTINVSSGFGIASEGLLRLEIVSVQLQGQIDDANALRYPIDPTITPAVGIAVAHSDDVVIENTTISGFAGFGGLFVDVDGSWTQGSITDNYGVGLLQHGGTMSFSQLNIERTVNCRHASCAFENQVFGMAVVGDAHVETDRVQIADNRGIGLLQFQATGAHVDMGVTGNGYVGVWLQEVVSTNEDPAFSLVGDETLLDDNVGGGIFFLDSGSALLEDTAISGTNRIDIPVDVTSTRPMADSLQIRGLAGPLTLRRVDISSENDAGDPRIGVLFDNITIDPSLITLEAVTVEGETGNGLVTQGFDPPQTWDIDVSEALQFADEHLEDLLNTAANIVGVPSAAIIHEDGLVGPNGIIHEDGSVNPNTQINENGQIGDPDDGE